eukprot:10727112-Ditylum_brightwellii.AAC.1
MSRGEHMPEIERTNRTIKERTRSTESTLPFTKVPNIIAIKAVNFNVVWLNTFAPKGGISTIFSPRNIIAKTQLDFKRHCKLPFGAYTQVHKDNKPTNSIQPCTVGAIALGPLFNIQGGYKDFNLNTGKLIH